MIPHPYFALVQKGAEAAAKDYNVRVYATLGQEFTQDNETQNVEALSTRGYKGSAFFPLIQPARMRCFRV
jgi:ribose transport system substrate-binding protein